MRVPETPSLPTRSGGVLVLANDARPRLVRHQLEAEGLGLPFRPLASLAQDEQSGLLGAEAGSGGGLGALTAPAGGFSAASEIYAV